MTASEETQKKPLWLSIEDKFLDLNVQDLSGSNKEAAIQKIAGELDSTDCAVSSHGGNMLQLRWAMDDMINVGRPFMKDFNDAISALTLEDAADASSATDKIINDLSQAWTALKKADRRPVVIEYVEKARLGLLVDNAKGMADDAGIRYLIGEKVEPEDIIAGMGITQEKLDQVNADIAAEKAERERVLTLLEAVDGKPNEERVKHLFDNDVAEALIIELAEVDQGVLDTVKKLMEEELKEKQRLEEEAAAKKKAEAEGPSLDSISSDEMIDYIDSIREILDFSEEEKEIRVMCEQSSIPKALVDIAVSDPDKLDELEKNAEE